MIKPEDAKMDDIVKWDTPLDNASPVGNMCCSCTVEDAIKCQKWGAEKRNHFYKDNIEALWDFIIINWAEIVRKNA